jgi:hypothetical protein
MGASGHTRTAAISKQIADADAALLRRTPGDTYDIVITVINLLLMTIILIDSCLQMQSYFSLTLSS